MKIKRESLETIIAMHKNICDDKDIATIKRVVAVFGMSHQGRRGAIAYATDGIMLARRELNELKTLQNDDNGLCEALESQPLFVLEQNIKAVEGLLRAFKHVREFEATFVSSAFGITGDISGKETSSTANTMANSLVIGISGQSVQVELGARGKVEGVAFDYMKREHLREHLDQLCEFKGATSPNGVGHETLVTNDLNCPLLGFNAFLLVSLVKALGGSTKDGGCQLTLLQAQSLHKDGKQVSTSQMRVTRKDSKDVGVLCGMRF